jgi:HK97 family phage major capsid protein
MSTDADGKRSSPEADTDRFAISISSETSVERWFGAEILDHSKSSVVLDRAESGLAFLLDHDTGRQIGIVESIAVRKDKRLGGIVRFSRCAEAQDVKRDLQDGIRPFISVGYRVHELVLESSSDEKGDVYRVTKWTPMEVSSVAVPADTSVGVGRSATEQPVEVRSIETAHGPENQTEVRTMEAKQFAELVRLGKVHGIDSERVAKWVEEERTVDSVSKEILAEIAGRAQATLTQPAAEHRVELTEKEQQRYSLCRAILAAADRREGAKADCFELEISDEIERKLDDTTRRHGGVFVPWSITVDPNKAARAAERLRADGKTVTRAGIATMLDTATTNQGKELVFTEPGPFIEYLYNRMVVKDLGAVTMSGLQGNIAFPKQTGKASGSWVTENPGTDVADSNLTLGQVLMSPKTYQSSSAYTRQLLAQSVVDIDNLVRADLAKDVALALDRAALMGDGADGAPKGIAAITGVQAYTMIADTGTGGKPAYADILAMEQKVEDVNADTLGGFGWVTVPSIKALLRQTPILANTIALPVWQSGDTIDGYPARITNQLPKDLEKSTGDNLTVMILGIWDQLLLGLWGSGFELVVDPYRLKKQAIIELTTFIMTDVAIRQAPAFVFAGAVAKS